VTHAVRFRVFLRRNASDGSTWSFNICSKLKMGLWKYHGSALLRYFVVGLTLCLKISSGIYYPPVFPAPTPHPIERRGLLFRIWEVTGSNIDSETRYPYWGFSWFLSVPLCKFLVLPWPHPFQFFIHRSFYHSTLVWAIETAVRWTKNKAPHSSLFLSVSVTVSLDTPNDV
jgi:hypothetical protein